MLILVLILLAVIILLIIWMVQPRNERGYRDKFNEFIKQKLTPFRKFTEIKLTEPIDLSSSQDKILIIGIDHLETIGAPWSLYLVSKSNDYRRIFPLKEDSNNVFWAHWVTSKEGHDGNNYTVMREPFEVQEVIWSERECISARVFRIHK